MRRNITNIVGALLVVGGGIVLALPGPANATGDVCAGLMSGKIDTTGNPPTVTMTAPPGSLITRYCIKAGSAQSGGGPIYIDVDPPQASITVGYPGIDSVSHYSFEWEAELPPTTLPETTLPATTLPETTLPATTLPDTTLPDTTLPDTTLPETTLPATTLPATTVPETTTSVSDSTVPDTTQPDTTVPETTNPRTTAPDTTGPSTTEPESTTTNNTPTTPGDDGTKPPSPPEQPPTGSQTLPRTGSGIGAQMALAAGLMLSGLSLMGLGRRFGRR
jgi:hypothetical protein